jgi:hypothetical protein
MAGSITAAVTIDRTFAAVVLDWDGTGGSHQRQRAAVRRRVEALCRAGVDVAVLSRASLAHLDSHLGARPGGPGRLMLCAAGGAEIYEVVESGLRRRAAVPAQTAGDRVGAGGAAGGAGDRPRAGPRRGRRV